MSEAALIAIKKAYATLRMDANPARLRWMAGFTEVNCALFKRRRALLVLAGSGVHMCYREWDELPRVARVKLEVVL